MKKNYSLWQRIFGPKVTDDDILNLEFRAVDEGWHDWLTYEMTTATSARKLKWLLAGLRDGYITVTVVEYELSLADDVYQDEDPFEID